jgi:hypothetical protein
MLLPSIETPSDLQLLSEEQLIELATEIRAFIVDAVTKTGGHLGSNLGVVELTIALHRVFDSPRDVLLFDTGHPASRRPSSCAASSRATAGTGGSWRSWATARSPEGWPTRR